MTGSLQRMACISLLAGLLGLNPAAADDVLDVGPFRIEAVERKISAGGFPNTSGNPFKRVPVTTYRVLHQGQPVVPPGTAPDRGAPWWDARVLQGPPQPAVLLLEAGAYLLTVVNGAPHLQELAPRDGPVMQWQWLDAQQGQPGPVTFVTLTHRPGPPRGFAGGGRWLALYGVAVLDTQTLQVYRYTLNSTEVLDQLQRFYAAEKPALAFSPGGTQFIVAGSRDRPEEPDLDKRFEHALIAFDFANQRGTVLPVDLAAWKLRDAGQIDAAFARRVVAWRTAPDGTEQACLRASDAATN